MNQRALSCAATLCCLLAAAPAHSDDLPTPPWNGLYIGAGAGIGGGRVRQQNLFNQDLSAIGASGSVRIGYDVPLSPRLFIGAFADLAISDETFRYHSPDYSFTQFLQQRYANSVGGRIGLSLNPSQAWYLTGGLTEAAYKQDIVAPSSWGPYQPMPHTLFGHFVGIGAETMLRDRLSLSLEFRHTQFDGATFDTIAPETWSERPSESLTRIALNYRFGGATAPVASEASPVRWRGLYIGAGGGYGSFTTFVDRAAPLGSVDIGQNAATGYFQAGYDVELSKEWLLGAFADYTLGKTDADEHYLARIVSTPGLALGARVGRSLGPALLYVTAGYARHDLTATSFDVSHYPNSTPDATRTKSTGGWFIGGGTETRLTDALSLKLEYRYATMDRIDFTFPGGIPPAASRNAVDQSSRLGLAYKF